LKEKLYITTLKNAVAYYTYGVVVVNLEVVGLAPDKGMIFSAVFEKMEEA
jgi:glutamate formiminotransferase